MKYVNMFVGNRKKPKASFSLEQFYGILPNEKYKGYFQDKEAGDYFIEGKNKFVLANSPFHPPIKVD